MVLSPHGGDCLYFSDTILCIGIKSLNVAVVTVGINGEDAGRVGLIGRFLIPIRIAMFDADGSIKNSRMLEWVSHGGHEATGRL